MSYILYCVAQPLIGPQTKNIAEGLVVWDGLIDLLLRLLKKKFIMAGGVRGCLALVWTGLKQ